MKFTFAIHLSKELSQHNKKVLLLQDLLTTQRVGFEPTRPLGQTVFKTASL